jgi:uncharacterized protein (TIGR00251 family)
VAAELSAVVTPSRSGTTVQVRVIPRAGRSQVAGVRGGALLLRIAAAPVDGAANQAVRELLATVFDVSRRTITIVSGERSRDKCVLIEGLDADAVRHRIHDLVSPLT